LKNKPKMSLEKKASIVASLTATFLIIIKVTIGILSGSVAVLASAIDSVLDLMISGFNYFALSKASEPSDKTFNYGKGKIEAIAAVIEGTVVATSGVFILYLSIQKLFTNEPIGYLSESILVMLISFVVTLFLVMFLNYVAKKTKNLVIKSDALHYKTDLFTNGAILISLVVIYFTDFGLVDAIMGFGISIYIIWEAYKIIKEGVFILLDGSLEEDEVIQIKEIIQTQKGLTDYHFLKTRNSANINFVDVHLVFENRHIALLDAHNIADEVEDKIKELDKDKEWVINSHLDPYDDSLETCTI